MMIKEWVTIDSLTPKLKSYMEIGFYECRLELNKETKQPTYQIRTNPKYYCEKKKETKLSKVLEWIGHKVLN